MRKIGKIVDYSQYEEVKDKNGETLVSKQNGLAVKKRQVVVDCSRINDDGDEIREGYVCDMFNEVDDSYLEALRTSSTKVAFYIKVDFSKVGDNYYQRITLKKIREITDPLPALI